MPEETKPATETEVNIPHEPGQVIAPSAAAPVPAPTPPPQNVTPLTVKPPEPAPPVAPKPVEESVAPVAQPIPTPLVEPAVAPPVAQTDPAPAMPEPELQPPLAQTEPTLAMSEQATEQEAPKSLFRADDEEIDAGQTPKQETEPTSWTASEFVHHEKAAGWYAALGGVSVLIAGAVYLLTKDVISAVVVVVAAFALGFYGARKPKQLDYQLDASGLSIGTKYFRYGEFKSFSVAQEGAFSSIVLMPLKRFAPLTTLYFAPENEAEIIKILSMTLPFEEHKKDAVDKLMHKIRF